MYQVELSALPRVTMMGRIKQKQGWGHTGRSIAEHLLVVLLDGECRFDFDREQLRCKKGDVVFVPANRYYRPHTDSWCEYDFFHFEAQVSQVPPDALPAAAQPPQSLLPADGFALEKEGESPLWLESRMCAGAVWEQLLLTIHKAYGCLQSRRAGRRVLLDVLFAQILVALSDSLYEQVCDGEPVPPLLEKMTYYIQQHFTEPVTLDSLSQVFGVSKQYIARLFRRHLQMTATQYIQEIKLEHSRKMLKYSTMNVGEIADYLGIGSSYYFCRLFKRRYALTPTQYIREEFARPLQTGDEQP